MKIFAGILTMILTVTIAITIGNRVPPETVAMAAGVVLGAAAAIPLSIMLGLVAPRRAFEALPAERPLRYETPARPYQMADSYASTRDYPPLVIINPSALQQASRAPAHAAFLDNAPMLSAPRQFRIVGDEAA